MSSVVTALITALGASLGQILLKLISFASELLGFVVHLRQDKKEEKEKQEIKEHNEKVKDACDNGTVEDLLNL